MHAPYFVSYITQPAPMHGLPPMKGQFLILQHPAYHSLPDSNGTLAPRRPARSHAQYYVSICTYDHIPNRPGKRRKGPSPTSSGHQSPSCRSSIPGDDGPIFPFQAAVLVANRTRPTAGRIHTPRPL
jgi:hypothetical protein